MYAKVNGTELFYKVLPGDEVELRGRTVCFALHGGPGMDHAGIENAFRGIAAEIPVVLYDQRGSGESGSMRSDEFSMALFCDDLEALRRHLKVERIVLAGISFGGMLALEYAARYHEALAALLPIVTAPSGVFKELARDCLVKLAPPPDIFDCADRLLDGRIKDEDDFKKTLAVLSPMYTSANVDRETILRNLAERRFNHEILNVFFREAVEKYDVTASLAGISAPTLVIGAENDWICPVECARRIHQGIPGSDLIICKNARHCFFDEQPDLFAKIVSDWLTSKKIS